VKNQGKVSAFLVALGLSALSSLAHLSCDDSKGGEGEPNSGKLSSEGRAVLDSWATMALDGYGRFELDSRLLSEQVEELCAAPTESRLKSAKAAYDAARGSWLRLRTFGFGPEEDLPLRLGPKINFQPPRHEDIEDFLKLPDPLPSPDRTGAHLRGFPALEYVLYGPPSGSLESEGLEGGERGCEFLLNVSNDLYENAALLRHAWAIDGENFASELLNPAEERHYFETEHDALSGLVGRMGYAVENLRDREIRDPMGEALGDERLELIVSALSGRTLEDFRDQITGLEELYFGGDSGVGLSPYARSEGVNLDNAFRGAFAAVRDAIEAVEPSFAEALVSDRAAVAELDRTLEELRLLYQVDLSSGLKLSQIFNDVDGD
jgi:predicted lipoprotein